MDRASLPMLISAGVTGCVCVLAILWIWWRGRRKQGNHDFLAPIPPPSPLPPENAVELYSQLADWVRRGEKQYWGLLDGECAPGESSYATGMGDGYSRVREVLAQTPPEDSESIADYQTRLDALLGKIQRDLGTTGHEHVAVRDIRQHLVELHKKGE